MKLTNICLTLVLITCVFNCSASETTESYNAHFDHDEDVLTKMELLKLKEHISTLGLTDAYEVIITGHTDANGTDEYNRSLSERRSKFILHSLLHFGLEESLVSIDWKGESDPIGANSNYDGRAKNRRVEIEIKRYTFNTTEDLKSALTKNGVQKFIIDPKVDQLIIGDAGVQVSIPANSFTHVDGNPIIGNVTVEMKEALTFGSFHDYGLSTASESQLLETGGMVYLDALDENGNQLSLDSDKQLSILLPSDSKEDRMELFSSNNGENWQPVGQSPLSPTWTISDSYYYDGPIRPMWSFFPPQFKLERKAPSKPIPPKKPRKPHEPREENYVVAPTLINKLFWKARTNEMAEKYAQHMAEYQHKQKRYEHKMNAYKVAVEMYPDKLAEYECALEYWNEYKMQAYLDFRKSDKYQKALKSYEKHYDRLMAKYDLKRQEWQCLREQRVIEMGEEADKTGFTNQQTINNYVYTLNKMGWINCDRFLNYSPNMLTQLQVTDPDTSDEVVLLVFKDVRSMISLYRSDDSYCMKNYPLNEEAEVFAYKVVEGKPMVCHSSVTGKSSDKLEFRPSSFSEIKSILKSFDENRTSPSV